MNKKSEVAPSESEEKKWEPLTSLRNEIDHLFDDFQNGWTFSRFRHRMPTLLKMPTPAVDVTDREKDVQIKAELPGMDENDVEVELSGKFLTISGKKEEEREEGEKGSNYYLSERRYGSFSRSIAVPDGINGDKVEASFNKGVLTITLPKTPETQRKTKKIAVKGKK